MFIDFLQYLLHFARSQEADNVIGNLHTFKNRVVDIVKLNKRLSITFTTSSQTNDK